MPNKLITIGAILIGLSISFTNSSSISSNIARYNNFGYDQNSGMEASVISSFLNRISCLTPGRLNQISISHHVGSPEKFTDFANCPTITAIKSGDWNDRSIWGGQLPDSNDIVLIPKDIKVTLKDSVKVKTLGVHGSFVFNESSNINLEVENFQTYPGSSLTITPNENSLHKVIFTGNLDSSKDPAQYGLGLVAMDSNVKIAGRSTRDTNSKIVSASAGSSVVKVVDNVSDWKVGQNVIFADTEKRNGEYVPNTEVKKITAISTSGNTISLNSPLDHTYKSSVVYMGQNVVFTSNSSVPGHIMFTGNTKLDFTGVYIEKMGRTRSSPIVSVSLDQDGEVLKLPSNQIGRYSLHLHHLEQAYYVAGNVINNTGDPALRWSATLHLSHGVFERNSIVNFGEAAIGVETYIDTGVVRDNLMIGQGGGYDYEQMLQSFGIWSRSAFISLNNNRVEGWIKSHSYYIDPIGSDDFLGKTFPNIAGSPRAGNVIRNNETPGTFSGNRSTAYVGFPSGSGFRRAGALWLGHFFGSSYTVDDFVSTHGGIGSYYGRDVYFNNVKLNETEKTSNSSIFGYVGIGSLSTKITNMEITGFTFGFVPGTMSEIKNSKFDNDYDFVSVIGDQDCYCHMDTPAETIVMDSVKFSPTGKHIVMTTFFAGRDDFMRKLGNTEEIRKDLAEYINVGPDNFARILRQNARVIVKNYNLEGKNFIVYPTYQSPEFSIPVVGVTNQELYEGRGTHPYVANVYGRSLGDHIVKNPISNSKIVGLVENITPMKVVPSEYYFHPLAVQSSYNLKYYTNANTSKINPSNFIVEYDGQEHMIEGVKGYEGLNKIEIKVDNKPYTLLLVAPKGAPKRPTDEILIEKIDAKEIELVPTSLEVAPLFQPESLKPVVEVPKTTILEVPKVVDSVIKSPNELGSVSISPFKITACPYETTVSIPIGKTSAIVEYSKSKVFATGGVGKYYVDPANLSFAGVGKITAQVIVTDDAGHSSSIVCNFNVISSDVKTLTPIVVDPKINITDTVLTNPISLPSTFTATCPYDSNVTIPLNQSYVIVNAKPNGSFTVDPANLLFSAPGVYAINMTATDNSNRKDQVICNFNVKKEAPVPVASTQVTQTQTVPSTAQNSTLTATCPYNQNVVIPANQTTVTVNMLSGSSYASGGTAPYTADPANLSFSAARTYTVYPTVRDSAGHSVAALCNFNVTKESTVSTNTVTAPTPMTQTVTAPPPTTVVAPAPAPVPTTVTTSSTGFSASCPYDTNVVIPAGASLPYTVNANFSKVFASGGTAPYTADPANLSFYGPGKYATQIKVSDRGGIAGSQSLFVACNFDVISSTSGKEANVFTIFDWFISLFR